MQLRPVSPGSPAPRRTASLSATLALAAVLALAPRPSHAFCGFYVAKADAQMWNQASEVVLVRNGDRTVLTMSNDFKGELKEFAVVVPVPTVLQREQIHVGERKLIDHLDAFSAPRLVEYFDDDPCRQNVIQGIAPMQSEGRPMVMASADKAKALGVTIEAKYTVGEYDILILGAKESSGLETWLIENGYKLPKGASAALAPYIKQGLKFFVAKVNLKEQAKTGFTYLRPLQMAYESARFMLPIRLGMVNAKGPQDLIVYVLTRNGRVETSNYRTVKIPSDAEVPLFVKEEFKDFYKAMFATTWKKEGENVAILEHFWDMAWCDPCAAQPLSQDELRGLGVFWVGEPGAPQPGRGKGVIAPQPQAQTALLTRLHVRYDAAHFPEDLVFQETRDRQNFQGRYILRHAFTGSLACPEAEAYVNMVRERREQQVTTTARLTGWGADEVRRKLEREALPAVAAPSPSPTPDAWWKGIWK